MTKLAKILGLTIALGLCANASAQMMLNGAGATWLLVYQQQKDPVKGKKLVEFLKWAVTKGEGMAEKLDYAPLPESVQQRILKRIDEIKA